MPSDLLVFSGILFIHLFPKLFQNFGVTTKRWTFVDHIKSLHTN